MIELVIGNSYSQIKGLNSQQFAEVRQLLSYEPDQNAAFFGGFQAQNRKYMIDKKGVFPTGLLSDVIGYFDHTSIVVKDNRIDVPSVRRFKLHDLEPMVNLYPSQKDAVKAAKEHGRGTISMPTGSGKSLVIAMLIQEFGLRTLVVVPNLSIKQQLHAVLHRKFGVNGMRFITVLNIDSPALEKNAGYDMVIIDEAHHVAAKTYHDLNKKVWADIRYRFMLTATPFRNVDAEQMLYKAIAGDVIYKLDYTEAVKLKYIVPVEAHYVVVPKQKTDAHSWPQVYSELVVNNQIRNEIIASLLTNLSEAGQNTLCLVKEIKHGQILAEMTDYPFVCGEDEESKHLITAFNSGQISGLIGTTGVIGEGSDTKPCEYVIIAGLGKAKSGFMQAVGRGVRRIGGKESAKIILFKDGSHKYCLRHFNKQSEILQAEYGVIPQKLEI